MTSPGFAISPEAAHVPRIDADKEIVIQTPDHPAVVNDYRLRGISLAAAETGNLDRVGEAAYAGRSRFQEQQ
jgi:hypothetical protein